MTLSNIHDGTFYQNSEQIKADNCFLKTRGGSRIAATPKVELFATIVNGFQPLTVITKSSALDVAAVQDPPLKTFCQRYLTGP